MSKVEEVATFLQSCFRTNLDKSVVETYNWNGIARLLIQMIKEEK